MPRKYRITEVGQYHIINRGVEGREVFEESADFHYFLELLRFIKKRFGVVVHSYTLLSDHYHLLIETSDTNIGEVMQYLNSGYSKYFNKKHGRRGHLWQGRYSSYYLHEDMPFLNVVKYIERNALVLNLVINVSEYPYQSLYLRQNSSTYSDVIKESDIYKMSEGEYLQHLQTPLDGYAMKNIYRDATVRKNDDGTHTVLSKSIGSFFESDNELGRNDKIIAAKEYGFSQVLIAEYLGLSTALVSKIISGKI